MHKIVHYRNRCIGCGVCAEQQPDLWRMSKKDGKATLLNGVGKKNVFIVNIPPAETVRSQETAAACPVRIIKLL